MKISKTLSASIIALCAFGQLAAHAETKLRFILDWKYQGQMGGYFLAADRAYFKDEGLDIAFDQGEGAGAAAAKIASGAYDVGFGSLDSIITLHAVRPLDAPISVDQLYSRSPFVIAVPKDSPIKDAKDLEGKTLGAPVFDGALKLFPTFAKFAKIEASKVTITNMAPNLRAQMLMRGQINGAFAFYTGIYMDTKLLGAAPDKDLRYLRYEDYGMDLYSNTIMVSQSLLKNNPDAVEGLLRAINRGIKDAHDDRNAAIDAVLKREPLLNRDIERERLDLMFSFDMSGPEVKQIGVGDALDDRIERNIKIIVDAQGLSRTPTASEVFNRSVLPPLSARLKNP
ncbi:MAG: ABC transporter substrate-binding protein [Xanthobacteraceae bacterium]